MTRLALLSRRRRAATSFDAKQLALELTLLGFCKAMETATAYLTMGHKAAVATVKLLQASTLHKQSPCLPIALKYLRRCAPRCFPDLGCHFGL